MLFLPPFRISQLDCSILPFSVYRLAGSSGDGLTKLHSDPSPPRAHGCHSSPYKYRCLMIDRPGVLGYESFQTGTATRVGNDLLNHVMLTGNFPVTHNYRYTVPVLRFKMYVVITTYPLWDSK